MYAETDLFRKVHDVIMKVIMTSLSCTAAVNGIADDLLLLCDIMAGVLEW